MRKVFLDNLPKKMRIDKEIIDWKGSMGIKVPFIYDDIEGEVEIINYDNGILTIKNLLNNEFFKIKTDKLSKCKLGKMLTKYTKNFKYNINNNIISENRDLIITDREYRERKHSNANSIINDKYYKYTCNKCGWTEGWIVEGSLSKGVGCSCCYNRSAVLGINTIWDTDRWMCDLGVSEEDARKFTKSSGKKIEVICPDCKKRKLVSIDKIYKNKSIGCSCGDGISYPEKFINDALNQLNVEFQSQLTKTTFEWCGDKRYDFYIPEYNMIIEAHGIQHYEDCNWGKACDIQENDRIKKELAKENGIEHYVVIDCRYSELEWIKNSILNSKLVDMLNLSKIDWLKCEEFALKNIVREVCDYWNNKEEWETTTTIAENNEWGIRSVITVIKYLKKGTILGWCNYNPKR